MTKVRTEQLQEALALGLRVGRTDGTTQVRLEGHGDTLRVSVNVIGDGNGVVILPFNFNLTSLITLPHFLISFIMHTHYYLVSEIRTQNI